MSITELPPGMAVGFIFHPTDEVLIADYLRPKIRGTHPEVDFYKFEPCEIEDKVERSDVVFFCKRDCKKPRSKRLKRSTKTGFWKITGKEMVIKDQETKKCIGKRKTLVFHKGPTPGQTTNWVVHEYYIEPHNLLTNQRPSYVLRRLKEKAKDKANTQYCGEGKSIGDIMSEVENPATPAAIPWAHGRQEENQKWFSQPNSPACNLTDEEISLPRSVGRFLYELQSSYGEPEARRKEIVNSRGDTNAEGVKEQHVLQSSLFDSSVGSKETRRFHMAETASQELQGNIPRERRQRRIQPRERVSSTAISGNYVREEAETNDPIWKSGYCVIAVIVVGMILSAAFGLLVFKLCKLALSQLRRKMTVFLLLCCVLFFWVYRKYAWRCSYVDVSTLLVS